jgi:hypothetical protein
MVLCVEYRRFVGLHLSFKVVEQDISSRDVAVHPFSDRNFIVVGPIESQVQVSG